MPTGYDNCCEMEVDGKLVTRPEVQHAELNAIAKLAENGYSSKDAAIFITHSPCIHCALLIQKCGISQVSITSFTEAARDWTFSSVPASR